MMPILKTIRVPTFGTDPFAFRDGNAVHPDDMPIELEPVDHNRVRITMGGVSRVVDGISLATAVDEVLRAYRCGQR